MHDHGNQAELFDRLDFKPSQAGHHQPELSASPAPGSRPPIPSTPRTPPPGPAPCVRTISATRPLATASAPTARLVGPHRSALARSAPTTSPPPRRICSAATTVLTFGGFARQDQYNYYPSRDPFSDLIARSPTPDRSARIAGSPISGLRANVSYVKGIHNIKAGATLFGHHPDREGQLWNRRPHVQRRLFELPTGAPVPQPVPHQSRQRAPALCNRIPASIRCWPAMI